MKKWAKDALIGEAHYGLGETFFTEDKCREALFEYGKVIQDYAKSQVGAGRLPAVRRLLQEAQDE